MDDPIQSARPLTGRHSSVQQIMRWLQPTPGLSGPAAVARNWAATMARTLLDELGDGPELLAGLRKLVEAVDCFARQAAADEQDRA